MSESVVSVCQLTGFCQQALSVVGASDAAAEAAAEALVTADSWGVFTHGSKLLIDYVRRIQAGGMTVDRELTVVAEGPSWAIVDAHALMGQLVGVYSMKLAVERARKTGMAYVAVRGSNHFAAAGYYAWLAAREGLLGIAMANDIPSVVAPGSRRAVTGSNPLAYAIPVPGGDPILLDMAISTVAGGKVYAAHQRGESIPDNWIVDQEGRPTADASLYPHAAALQPMTGAKGYGIGLLIETLSGVLSGAAMMWQVSSCMHGDLATPTNHGAAFIAIDIAAMMSADQYAQRIQHIVDEVHHAPTVDGVERVMLPGEREWQRRRTALRDGIALPADVVAKLTELAELVGIAWPPHAG